MIGEGDMDRRMIIMTVTTIIIIFLIISAKYMILRYWEEWKETSVDNIAKMRNCACHRCQHMIALWEEYLPYSE